MYGVKKIVTELRLLSINARGHLEAENKLLLMSSEVLSNVELIL